MLKGWSLTWGTRQQTPGCQWACRRGSLIAVRCAGTAGRLFSADRQRHSGGRCGLGWLATQKNTITGDFADVKGLRNSNDNYLWNNVAFNRVQHRGYRHSVAAPIATFGCLNALLSAWGWRLCKQWLSKPLSWAGFKLPPCPQKHDHTLLKARAWCTQLVSPAAG